MGVPDSSSLRKHPFPRPSPPGTFREPSPVVSLSVSPFLVFYKKIYLKDSEVWRKVVSNKIIVTLVTQGLPSSFLVPSCCVSSLETVARTVRG